MQHFIHFTDTTTEDEAAGARQIRYYKECALAALLGDRRTAPTSYGYFVDMVERLVKLRPEDLTESLVFLGSPARIVDPLNKVEAAGFDGVILCFNVGLKLHLRSRMRWRAAWPKSRPSSSSRRGRRAVARRFPGAAARP